MLAGSKLHLGSAIALGAFLALPGAASAQQTSAKQVTFSKDVAPIFQAKCQSCHEPGSIGLALGLLGALLSAPAPAVGQENFEIQVYGSETVPPGTTMVELHSNVAADGTTRTENGDKVICQMERPLGSNIARRVCRTEEATAAERQAAQDAIRLAPKSGLSPRSN